jgi:hypothetical protein
MKPNPICAASSPSGTRLRMTATSLLDLFPALRNASRESLSRRTGRRLVSCNAGRTETLLYRHPAYTGGAPDPHLLQPVRQPGAMGRNDCRTATGRCRRHRSQFQLKAGIRLDQVRVGRWLLAGRRVCRGRGPPGRPNSRKLTLRSAERTSDHPLVLPRAATNLSGMAEGEPCFLRGASVVTRQPRVGLVILFAQDLACGGVHKMDLLAHGTEDRLILVVT